MKKRLPEFKFLGESALLIQWDNVMNMATNEKVNALAAALIKAPFEGLKDLVPAYCSLTVLYDPVVIRLNGADAPTAAAFVTAYIRSLLIGLQSIETNNSRLMEIPVCYDLSLGNDLQLISDFSGLSIPQVMEQHLAATYYVYMPGFLPGFVYMGSVSEKIAIPRKVKPVAVKAGAVGIAGRQTGIYPVATPGGWYIAGYTPLLMFDPHAESPCRLLPGDQVIFKAIDISEYHQLKIVAKS